MKIGIPKEIDDKRVAVVPSVLSKIKSLGVEVLVEKGAGVGSSFSDDTFVEEATICDRDQLLNDSKYALALAVLIVFRRKTIRPS